MKRCRTVMVEKSEVDFMVLEFSSRDSSVLSSLGKHCKETRWKIAVGMESAPIDIQLTVDKQVALSPEVSVLWNGKQIFPETGSKSKLKEDFKWRAPFRGTIKGLKTRNHFEVRPEHLSSDHWFAATLTEQREDGLFKALVMMPDPKTGVSEVCYPAVKIENIREAAGMKKPVTIPQRTLYLQVPVKDPLHALLTVDSGQLMTHFFARPSPPPGKGPARILFKVSQDRQQISTDVGHSILQHFHNGEVRFVEQTSTKLKRSWTLQCGPFARHVIELERKYGSSKVATLTVDGTVLCESNGEDIESRPNYWECSFRLMGQKSLDWEVFETDINGDTLPTTGIVSQKSDYSHECVVTLMDSEKDLTAAKLLVDEIDAMELAEYKPLAREEHLKCSPEALRGSCNLEVPFKVNEEAPTKLLTDLKKNMVQVGNNVGRIAETVATNAVEVAQNTHANMPATTSWFFSCCSRSVETSENDVVVRKS